MDHRDEVREFLASRRARITPEQAGLPPGSGRRVPGLRRAEVAVLANVSVEYYAKLERGRLSGVSETVLEAVARALRLDEAERAYLFDLARTANRAQPVRRRRTTAKWTPRPALQHMLDAIDAPAYIRNGRLDVLASNRLCRAFHTDLHASTAARGNLARLCFLDPERAHRFYTDWDAAADIVVASLRSEVGRDPHDKSLHDLVGELSTRSEEFRTRWAARNVRIHSSGVKRFGHPVVGDLEFAYENFDLVSEPGLSLVICAPEPASASDERLRLLASWAAGDDAAPREPDPARGGDGA